MPAGEEPDRLIDIPPLDSEEFNTLLRELSVTTAPRRFALCEVRGDEPDGWVFAWGSALDGRAVVIDPDGRRMGAFRCAEEALAVCSRFHDLWLVWIDPETGEDADPE